MRSTKSLSEHNGFGTQWFENILIKHLTTAHSVSIISKYVKERTEFDTDAPIAQRIECPATNR